MGLILQWIIVGLAGCIAVIFLLRSFGLLGPRHKAEPHCAKCESVQRMTEMLDRLADQQKNK